jgi:hypothetical protein
MSKINKTDKNETRSTSGTYIYDKAAGKVVKVSDKVPSIKKGEGCCGCTGDCPHHH